MKPIIPPGSWPKQMAPMAPNCLFHRGKAPFSLKWSLSGGIAPDLNQYIYTHTLHLAGGELCYVDFPTYPLCFWDLVGLGRPCELTIHHEEDRHMFPVDTPLWIITDVRHLCLSENKVLQKCLLIKPCYFPIWWIYPQFLDNSKYHIVGEYLNTPSYPIISRQDKLPPSGASPQRHMQIKGAMSRMRRGSRGWASQVEPVGSGLDRQIIFPWEFPRDKKTSTKRESSPHRHQWALSQQARSDPGLFNQAAL